MKIEKNISIKSENISSYCNCLALATQEVAKAAKLVEYLELKVTSATYTVNKTRKKNISNSVFI